MAEYEDEDDIWLVNITVPNMRDVTITKIVKFDDLPATVQRIRRLMPELKVTQGSVTKALKELKDFESD